MKALLLGVVLAALAAAPVAARQQADRLFERITLEQPQPSPTLRWFDPADLDGPKRLGIFSLVPPQKRGEIVRVSIPLPDLVSRAFKGVAVANRQRQEKAARQRVEAALKAFAAEHATPRP